MNARVFLPHPVMVSTAAGRRWKFPIEGIVREFGPIITLLDNSDMMLTPGHAMIEMERVLREHNFDPAVDYVLAAGDMTAYAAMQLVSFISFGSTAQQLRHARNGGERQYDILPPFRGFELKRLIESGSLTGVTS
jgi:hypothetical protein